MRTAVLTPLLLTLSLPAFAVPDECDEGEQEILGTQTLNADANVTITPTDVRHRLGWSTAIGRFNDDAIDDLVVAAPTEFTNGAGAGAVYVFFGPLGADAVLDASTADVTIYGDSFGDRLGYALSTGDTDLDGRDELLIGTLPTGGSSAGAGLAYLVSGTDIRDSTIIDIATTATATFVGSTPNSEFGSSVLLTDVDNDGLADVLIGAPKEAAGGTRRGAAFLFHSPAAPTSFLADADATFYGALDNSSFGISLSSADDRTGDGMAEFAIGATRDSTVGSRAGAVYIFDGGDYTGSPPAPILATAAPWRLYGKTYARTGSALSLGDDLDGDGIRELWVGSKQAGPAKRGAVTAHLGGDAAGTYIAPNTAFFFLSGGYASELAGTSLDASTDLNGDGTRDLVIGGERGLGETAQSGVGIVQNGPFQAGGFIDLRFASGRLNGGAYRDFAGRAVAAGDLNDDGYGDAVVGAWRNRLYTNDGGSVSLFLGGADLADNIPWYADVDGDGYGDAGDVIVQCTQPDDYVDNDLDCNDGSTAYQPGAPEACGDPEDYNCDGFTGNTDNDGDGVDACDGDCDDDNRDVNPNADEICGDAIDNNCDGAVDDATAIDAETYYLDVDLDGFGLDITAFAQCGKPSFAVVSVGGDCDDDNRDINPDAIEVCDTVDNNCDGVADESTAADATTYYRDEDADTFGNPFARLQACEPPSVNEGGTIIEYVTTAGDCDDQDFLVKPGEAETCDTLDNDCDGIFYLGHKADALAQSVATFTGTTDNARLGAGDVSLLGDIDLDGDGEVGIADIFSDLGAVDGGVLFIRRGDNAGGDFQLDPNLTDRGGAWDIRVVGSRLRGRLGAASQTGDFNGDGFADLAVGAPGARVPLADTGAVYVFYGPLVDGTLTLTDADVILQGSAGGDLFGGAIDVADLDGDNVDDLLIGARGALGTGAAYVVYGDASLPGVVDATAMPALAGTETGELLGRDVQILGDLNGDTFVDIAAGAPDAGALDAGAVYIVYGTASRFTGALTADAVIVGSRASASLGESIAAAGDINDDGLADILLGNAAPLTSDTVDNVATAGISGNTAANVSAVSAAVGDVNGDGIDDLAFGSPEDDEAGRDAGAVYVLYGTASFEAKVPADRTIPAATLESFGRVIDGTTFPTISAANTDSFEGVKILGEASTDEFGTHISGGNLDGLLGADLLVSAPGVAADGDDRGRVYAFAGGPYGTDLAPVDGSDETWFADLDQDGWTDPTSFVSCAMHVPTDLRNVVLLAGNDPSLADDCNDGNAAIHPCHPESDGDTVDSNCDSLDDIQVDGDGDGLSYSDELNIFGTCPDLADTDGDGVDDDDEIARGSDPNDGLNFILGIEDLNAGDLRITEVMPNPQACSDSVGEYVEVLYQGSARIDLSGLDVSDNTNTRTLSGLLLVNPGDRFVLAGSFTGFATCYGFAPSAQFTFGLGNGGDSFTIEANGSEIDSFSYTSGEAVSGTALELDDFDLATWCSADAITFSGDLGSPGIDNGACGSSGFPGVDTINPTDLRITEVMVDPDACPDDGGEYIEVLYTGTPTVDLVGLLVEDTGGSTAMGSKVVSTGDRIIISRTATQYINCYGTLPDGQFGFGLDNSGDIVRLRFGGTTFDEVNFLDWDTTPGVAFERDDGANQWCLATTAMLTGDLGSAGSANGACTPNDFDWDGIADDEEACVGGNPFRSDTDGDGTIDGAEQAAGTNVNGTEGTRTWRFIADVDNVVTAPPAVAPGWSGEWGGLITFDPSTPDLEPNPDEGLYDLTGSDVFVQVDALLAGGTSNNGAALTDAVLDAIDLDLDAPNTLGDASVADVNVVLQMLGYIDLDDTLPSSVDLSDYLADAAATLTYTAGGSDTVSGTVTTLCLDDDLDGICNDEEIANGTNPWSADSDGDGLTDREETNRTLTGLCDTDSDDDGASDGVEDTVGTDPLDNGSRPLVPDDLVPGDLQITEFMANPTNTCGDSDGEYFEVVYSGAAVAVLDGLLMSDSSGLPPRPLDGGVIAFPGDRLVFAGGSGFGSCYGFAADAISGLSLNNGGDVIVLANSTQTLAEVDFEPGNGFTIAEGVAEERDTSGSNLWCDADVADYIAVADAYGTPGLDNGACPPPSSNDSVNDLAPGDLIITEFMNDPGACADGDGEYVEVLYLGANPLDLDGLIFADAAGTETLASTSVLNPNDRAVLFRGAGDLSGCYTGSGATSDARFTRGLNNGGSETITISNASGVLDSVTYDGGDTVTGRAQRLSEDDGVTWCSDGDNAIGTSGDFGTPGQANGNCPAAPTGAADVLISALMDHQANFRCRFIEIHNAGDAPATLSEYSIKRYSNGSSSSSATISLSGPDLAPGDTFTVGNNSGCGFTGEYGSEPDQFNGNLTGNGDDAFELVQNGSAIDVYGVIGEDGSGKNWEYTDSVALRHCNVLEGTNAFDINEWTILFGNAANADYDTRGICPEGVYSGTADLLLNGAPCPGSASVTLDLDPATWDIEGTGTCVNGGSTVNYAVIGLIDLPTGEVLVDIVDNLTDQNTLDSIDGSFPTAGGSTSFLTTSMNAGVGGFGALTGTLDLPLQ